MHAYKSYFSKKDQNVGIFYVLNDITIFKKLYGSYMYQKLELWYNYVYTTSIILLLNTTA